MIGGIYVDDEHHKEADGNNAHCRASGVHQSRKRERKRGKQQGYLNDSVGAGFDGLGAGLGAGLAGVDGADTHAIIVADETAAVDGISEGLVVVDVILAIVGDGGGAALFEDVVTNGGEVTDALGVVGVLRGRTGEKTRTA